MVTGREKLKRKRGRGGAKSRSEEGDKKGKKKISKKNVVTCLWKGFARTQGSKDGKNSPRRGRSVG